MALSLRAVASRRPQAFRELAAELLHVAQAELLVLAME